MPVYPRRKTIPACRCRQPLQTFWCPYGHLTECHSPKTCLEAECAHSEAYEALAAEVITAGMSERAVEAQ